jgi:hypothetical protein
MAFRSQRTEKKDGDERRATTSALHVHPIHTTA